MDSLLATYSSSDDEDDHHHQQPPPPPPPTTTQTGPPSLSSKASSLFSSLPKPQSSSSSSSSSSSFTSKTHQIHKPQQQKQQDPEDFLNPNPKSSPLFSTLPPPKSQPISEIPIPTPTPKRVVQFRPPVPQVSSKFDTKSDDEEEEDEEERERKKKRQLGHDVSVKSFLSSMPAPKSSGGSALGALPNSGSGRRSIVETEALGAGPMPVPMPVPVPETSSSDANGVSNEIGLESKNWGDAGDGSHSYNYAAEGVAGDQSYAGYGGYGSSAAGYDSYGSYAQYGGGWSDNSSGATAPETSETVDRFMSGGGKRRKDQPPPEIVEVKQDELMKNRPTEDKAKMTGLAFGPSYQPTSTKGKPSKLHKRKHQIGALFFDLKQKEMELAERRSKGILTKAETQAKYGW